MIVDAFEIPGNGAPTSFVAFVLEHAKCADAVVETRLDGDTIACRCVRCDVTAVFASAESKRHAKTGKIRKLA